MTDDQPPPKLPAAFLARYGGRSPGRIFGIPFDSLSRKELLAVIVSLGEERDEREKQHRGDMNFLATGRRDP